MSKRNTIDCSDFLSKELKIDIKNTRNYISMLTGAYKNDSNNKKSKRRRNNNKRN